MQIAYVVTGTVMDAQTVRLDEALPITGDRVRLYVVPASASAPGTLEKVEAEKSARPGGPEGSAPDA